LGPLTSTFKFSKNKFTLRLSPNKKDVGTFQIPTLTINKELLLPIKEVLQTISGWTVQ